MPSIRDFSGGVLNQELLGKDSGAGIMIDANNVLSSWNGELRKRTGTRIVAQLEKKSRIIPYRLPNNDDALLVFTDGNVKGYNITESGITPLPVNSDVSDLQFPTSGWVSNINGDWEISSNISSEPPIYEIFNTHQYTNQSSLTSDTEGNKYIQFYNQNTFTLMSLMLKYRDTGGDFDRFDNATLQWSDDGVSWTPIKTSESAVFKRSEPGFAGIYTQWTELNITNVSGVYVPHKYWRVFLVNRVGSHKIYVEAHNIKVVSSDVIFCDFPSNFPEESIQNITFAQIQNAVYFACKKYTPMVLNQGAEVAFKDFVPAQTTGVWTSNGNPSCVAAYQNRLCFAGFEFFGNRVILSEFGNFENFTKKNTDVLATDPLEVDSVEIRAVIDNLFAGNNALYALSSDGVAMLDAQGGIVATDQINFKLRNREPADGMTPTTKDDIMIYLGNDRRKIFITDYDFIVQRFKAKDLSIGYNGFLTSRIVALHYASRKCSLIYGYKDDGNMLALLFDTDMQKNALFPCDIGGDIKDMQVFKSGDKFRVLMVAQIEDRWYLIEKNEQPEYAVMDFMTEEQKSAYTQTVMSNGLYLDYMTRRYYNGPVTTISDLPYGNNQMVAVFADGVYVGEKVCQDGAITLDLPAQDFILGYNYDAYVAIKLATPYANIKYPKEVSTYLINTGYLEIGNSFDNLQPILNNMKDKLDLFDRPKFINGEYTKTMDKLENSPYIILRSKEPMPFMITGLDFKVDYSNYQGGI